MKIPCPNCNQRLDIPEELSGQTIECPACNSSIIIPDSDTLVPEQNDADTDKISKIPTLQSKIKSKPSPKPSRSPKIKKINPVSRMMNEDSDDGVLHDFLSDKLMIGIPIACSIVSLLILTIFLGPIGLIVGLISLGITTIINSFLFIKTTEWICGRFVQQTAALITIFFTSSISGLLNSLAVMVSISNNGIISLLLLFAIQTYVFQLRLKEGFIKALAIAVIMFVLNIILMFVLGCVFGLFAIGAVGSQM
ncbi:MAG: hypothetical protein EVA72_06585 [Limisphaerales bacterium]|nr:MAG: hypothetical protein EVA72_06585 [Limisphaerales bacterium]|tara:strand:- start:150 stop:902 length:753 start_codon:yes stop_codon:yes gene_type:complete